MRLSVLVLMTVFAAGCTRTPQQKETAFLAKGKAALERKDYPRAILEFKNAVKIRPSSTEAHYELGLAYLGAHEYSEAVAFLKKATELDPKNTAAQLKVSELMATSRNPEVLHEATERLQSVLLTSGENAEALRDLAVVEMRLGKPDEALSHLEKALDKFPTHLSSAVTLARIDVWNKDYRHAEEVLKNVVERAPKSVDARMALGRLYVVLRKSPEAEAQFRQALAIDPKSKTALYDLGSLLALTGRQEEAGKLFEQLSSSSEKIYRPFYARYLFDTGKRQEAIARFEKLVKEDPEDRQLRSLLVLAYLAVNRVPDAENILTQALKKNPKDVEALEQRSQLRLLAGKTEDARKDLREVLRISPDSASAHYLLAKAYSSNDSRLLYQQELGEALRLDPKLLEARVELARALRASKGAKAAVELMDQAPNDQKATVGFVAERNWSLIELQDEEALRKGIDQGLKLSRTAVLLLQDGLLKLRHKDFAGARGSLEEALRSAPDDTRILETLAGSYVVQNQGPRSIQLVRDYASARPKSPRAQYFLGTWLLRMRDLQGARTAFELVKSLDPAFSEADIALARLDAGEGKTGPACERLAKLLAGNGRNLPALLLLGEIEYAAGNAAAAAEHLRKAVDMEPRNPKALNDLAYVLADGAGRPDEALKFAQQAYEDQPGSALVRDTIGWVYYKKGFYDAAVRYLESAVSAQGAAIYRYHLAMAYHKAGKFDSARETYRRALAADAKLPEAKAAKELIETKAATNLDR